MVHTIKVGLVRFVARTPQAARPPHLTRSARSGARSGHAHGRAAGRRPLELLGVPRPVVGQHGGRGAHEELLDRRHLHGKPDYRGVEVQLLEQPRVRRGALHVPDGRTFTSIRREWDNDALLVKSLTDHWSAGVRGAVSSSTYYNVDLAVEAMPAVEWNFFPYSQSTRREFTVPVRDRAAAVTTITRRRSTASSPRPSCATRSTCRSTGRSPGARYRGTWSSTSS